MAFKQKYTYWHLITFVDPRNPNNQKVGDCIGLDEKTEAHHYHDPKIQGFFISARYKFIGKLPRDYHETNPTEAWDQIDEWKKQAITIQDQCCPFCEGTLTPDSDYPEDLLCGTCEKAFDKATMEEIAWSP